MEHKFNVGRQLPEEPSSTFESDSAKPETDKESKETYVIENQLKY